MLFSIFYYYFLFFLEIIVFYNIDNVESLCLVTNIIGPGDISGGSQTRSSRVSSFSVIHGTSDVRKVRVQLLYERERLFFIH